MDKSRAAAFVKAQAEKHGFLQAGIARAEFMDPEARRLEEWLSMGNHGSMSYMERYFDLRTDPSKLVPGAKSVISLLFNYYPEEKQQDPTAPRVARYAFGEDYHKVLRRKLKQLLASLREHLGEINGRCFVDSGPVLERDWARRSGVGWIGKNTLLLNTKAGSYFFLAEIISDLELESDQPIRDHCGTCRRCIDACPTGAIAEDGYVLDSNKCISYLTIERKDPIPDEFQGSMENWVFGCDICQEVCPWNRFSTPHQESAFAPKPEFLSMTREQWYDLTSTEFDDLFGASAITRAGYPGIVRNLHFLQKGEQTRNDELSSE